MPFKIAEAFVDISAKGIDTVGSSLKKIGNVGATVGNTLKKAFGPITLLVGAAVALKEMVSGFNEGVAADNKLVEALKASGAEVDNNAKNLSELALQLRSVTTLSDDEIKRAMALGIQMGIGADKIGDYSKAAIGLSKALGISVEEAMAQLAKEASGIPSRLNKSIPALDGITDASERLAIISKFAAGGMALEEKQAQTLEGRMKQLWEVLGDLGDIIMNVLAPVLTWIAVALKKAAQLIQAAFAVIAEAAEPYLKIAGEWLTWFGEQATAAGATLLDTMMPALSFLGTYLQFVADTAVMLGNKIYEVALSFLSWVEQITGIEMSWANMRQMAGDAMAWIKNAIAEVIFRVLEWDTSLQIIGLNIQRAFAVAANAILDAFGSAQKAVAYFFNNFEVIAGTIINYVVDTFWKWVEQAKGAFKSLWDYVSSLGEIDVKSNFDGVQAKGQGVIDSLAKGFVDMIDVNKIDGRISELNKHLDTKRPKYQEDLAKFESKARGAISNIAGKIAGVIKGGEKVTVGPLGLSKQGEKKGEKKANEGVGATGGILEAWKKLNESLVKSQMEKVADKQLATQQKMEGHLATIAKNSGPRAEGMVAVLK